MRERALSEGSLAPGAAVSQAAPTSFADQAAQAGAPSGARTEPGPLAEPDPWYRRGNTWVWLTGALVPVLMAAGIAAGVAGWQGQADRATETQEARWNELQQELSTIRAGIAVDAEWGVVGGGSWTDDWSGPATIRVTSAWEFVSDGPVDIAEQRARDSAQSAGWVLVPVEPEPSDSLDPSSTTAERVEYEAERADGARLSLVVTRGEYLADALADKPEMVTETRTLIDVVGAPHPVAKDIWINWRDRIPAEEMAWELYPNQYAPTGPVRLFAPNEWPSLAKVDSTMF